MHRIINCLFLYGILLFASCRPTPIDIDVPQQKESLTISSTAINDHTVIIAAGYSINSLVNLEDSLKADSNKKAPLSMLVDSATVTIAEQGQAPHALTRLTQGMYGSRSFHMTPGIQYTFTIIDHKKNLAATATTVFVPKPEIQKIAPEIVINGVDTIVKLNLSINAQPGDYFYVHYTTSEDVRAAILSKGLSSLNISFEPKRLELFTGADAVNGTIEKSLKLLTNRKESVAVTIGKIDASYYKYLDAYKRTGNLINQLTGEPINLPTNINEGYGYFSLHVAEHKFFDLAKY